MGIPVMIMGASGSGKSTSMRNMDGSKVGVLNVSSKPLPFRNKNHIKVINHATYNMIIQVLKKQTFKCYVIDDTQYLMAFDSFDRAKETGYGKFTDMAQNFYSLIRFVIDSCPDDCIVYFLHHTETNDFGKTKPKTLGKMLDNQLTVEGLFSIVLMSEVEGNEYKFITNSDGSNVCKSPMEMFEMKIDNDLNFVDKTIREYYGLDEEEKGE